MDREGAAALLRRDRDLAYILPAADARLTIWEDAVDRGYVARETIAGLGMIVAVTEDGERLLRAHGRVS